MGFGRSISSSNYSSNVFLALSVALLLLLGGVSSAPSSTSPARIVSGFFSNAVSASMKWLWSLKSTTRTAIVGRPMMKFETGYSVETVFDGSKLGIEPYAMEVLPNGELLILDSSNSNLYRISSALSLYSRPKLVAGSAEGYAGHVDGKVREARMNHPKGVAVDDRGNIYIADTMNMAIRKISDSGITTIAGGKSGRAGHVDGASEDAKFSNDFDVVYIGSSCSLLVIDRGNRAVREIQLHFEDCAYQYGSGFPFGVAVLLAAGLLGYMLALLQRRVGSVVSPQNDQGVTKMYNASIPSDKAFKSVRPPLIPTEDEPEKQEEGFIGSIGRLLSNAGASVVEMSRGIVPGLGKKPQDLQYQNQQHSTAWPMQDSYVIRDDDGPPSIETRTPTPKKTYAFMSKDAERVHQWQQGKSFYSGWDELKQQRQQQHHQSQSSIPHTYYEQSNETTKEVVFGAFQEQDGKRKPAVIKPVNYGDSGYNHQNMRWRNYQGYSSAY